jgi:adenylate cyclase
MTEDDEPDPSPRLPGPPGPPPPPPGGSELAARVRDVDERAWLVRAAQGLRRRLPGDDRYGDTLSTSGDLAREQLARRVAELNSERSSASREFVLGALQVWQSLSESTGRGRGEREVTILFTDLVGFSSWALEAQDDSLVRLLRAVTDAVEGELRAHRGRVVKRLGDGTMAVFADADDAVAGAFAAHEALDGVTIDGYQPKMRVGMHTGRPRKMGDDFLGVDVNIAARVAQAAGADEVLVSEATLERIESEAVTAKRKRFFRAKGAPKDLKVHAVTPG